MRYSRGRLGVFPWPRQLRPTPPATNRALLIDRSSMSVEAGKATLTIGPLERTETGDLCSVIT